jgi:hypothetical protein
VDKMKLEDLKGEKIRWDLTPQKYLEELNGVVIESWEDIERLKKLLKERVGKYFYIDVWNCTPCLFLMDNDEDGNGKAEIVEQDIISEDEMLEAIEEAGGSITISGHYPINKKIEKKLKKFLYGGGYEK